MYFPAGDIQIGAHRELANSEKIIAML